MYFLLVDYKIEEYVIQIEELSEVKYVTIEEFIKELKEKNEKYTYKYEELKETIQKLIEKRKELEK